MTSLHETLPVLDESVPALPQKLEEVAKESDTFHQAAGEAVAALKSRREQAESLVSAVRQALEALRENAQEEEKRVADASQALQTMAEEQLRELDESEGQVTTEGEQAKTALGELETHLESGTQRTRAAHEEARAALEALAEEARTKQPELDAAVDAMNQAVKAAQQAVADGQEMVEQGAATLKSAMDHLLAQAQQRLTQTHQYLDEIKTAQEAAVTKALAALEGEREQLEQVVVQALHDGVQEALEGELDAVVNALADVGQHVTELDGETQSRREDLARQIAEVEERIGPLQQGTQQVRGAADRLGLDWPY